MFLMISNNISVSNTSRLRLKVKKIDYDSLIAGNTTRLGIKEMNITS